MYIDSFDRAILARLTVKGTATHAELGEAVNLSGPAVGRRQRLLEKNGIIRGYQANLDFARLEYGAFVLVLIRVEKQSTNVLSAFEDAILKCASVLTCHLLSGSEDYIVTLRARDLPDFEKIHRDQLSKLPGVSQMQSLFSLREVVMRAAPPSIFFE